MSSLFTPAIPTRFSTDEAFLKLKKNCRFLAKGSSRRVYTIPGDRDVLKAAIRKETRVCNWSEISAYHAFSGDQEKLAEVVSWSTSGRFLVMERLTDTDSISQFDFPSWVTDRKYSNVGKSRTGTYKMCDFAWIVAPNSAPPSAFR